MEKKKGLKPFVHVQYFRFATFIHVELLMSKLKLSDQVLIYPELEIILLHWEWRLY